MATTLALAAVVTGGVACTGAEPPEEKLDELSEKQQEAQSQVADAEEQLRERRKTVSRQKTDLAERRNALEEEQRAVDEARKELTQAQQKLERAEKRLRDVRREIAREVSDVALFRHIQKSLLEKDELSQVAISVAVRDHVVTLEGEVPARDLQEVALGVARSTPGVLDVKNRIIVRGPEPTKAPEESSGEKGDRT